jgi:hypothetical protein
MTMHRCIFLLACCLPAVLGGCSAKARKGEVAAPVPVVTFLRAPAFEQCELEGFVATDLGRQALLFGETREKLLEQNGLGELQRQAIEALHAGIRDKTVSHYAAFAADRFYACAERLKLPVARNTKAASVCFARTDIQFFAQRHKEKGLSAEQARANFRTVFKDTPKEIFPDSLVDELTNWEYQVERPAEQYELRRFILESCLFPEEWKRWYNSLHPEDRRT